MVEKLLDLLLTEGYHYEESEAVIGDQFVGLALDEGNQGNDTPERIEKWIADIKPQFN